MTITKLIQRQIDFHKKLEAFKNDLERLIEEYMKLKKIVDPDFKSSIVYKERMKGMYKGRERDLEGLIDRMSEDVER